MISEEDQEEHTLSSVCLSVCLEECPGEEEEEINKMSAELIIPETFN